MLENKKIRRKKHTYLIELLTTS